MLIVFCLTGPAYAQSLGDWGTRQWLGPDSLSISEAVQRINPEDQREWLTYLASPALDGRVPKTDGFRKAVEYIEAQCAAWGIKTERQAVPNRDRNLLAYIPGVGPSADEIVVVGVHLDHLGNGKLGADDNGSGSTAVMSVAYALSLMEPGPRTVVCQWYTAEESGLIGSQYYVNHPTFPKSSPSIRKHVAMVNLDMVGRLSSKFNARENVEQLEQTAEFSAYIKQLTGRYPFASDITITTGSRSDHASFRSAGVPAAWMFTGTHSDYHEKGDVVSKINFGGLTKIARYTTELTNMLIHEGHASSVAPFALDEEALHDHGCEPEAIEAEVVPSRPAPAASSGHWQKKGLLRRKVWVN
jgi:hypothetical protein